MGALLLLAPLGFTPAHASSDDTAVTTMTGPGSALGGMYLTYVGCDATSDAAAAPATRINRGPDTAPMGLRSFGLVPAGLGTASGPTFTFLSLAALDAGVHVRAESGTTGASHIWLTTPEVPAGHAWRGRAALTVPAATWQHVRTAEVPHAWELVDLLTGASAARQTATPAEFVAAHGDGPGLLVTGFGCDGQAFNIDAVHGNGGTWDFEGLTLKTAIVTSSTQVAAGEEVSVTGSVADAGGRVTGDPLILQTRLPGQSGWSDASPLTYAGADGLSQVTTTLTETRELRWLRPASEYADAGASEPVLVSVQP